MKTEMRRYHAANLCVLPARRAEKRPVGTWKQFQKRLPTETELSAWMANDPDAICILTGKISGNLEMIDFDNGGELFDAWSSCIPADILPRLVIEKTQSGGQHVIYRCQTEICGNLKLAQRADGDKPVTLIETRGQGGLFLCAPTTGYELMQGDLAAPPLLTEDQRDALLQAAWELNEYIPPVVDGPKATSDGGHTAPLSAHSANNSPTLAHQANNPAIPAHNANRPGDDFNDRGDVRAVLENHGWTCTKGGENEYWRRPGKISGTSATLKERVFYVFSSNAPPFEPNGAYSPFAVYAILEHGGDFSAATRALSTQGFGQSEYLPTGVDISGIVGMSADNSHNGHSRPDISDPGPIPEHLFHVPGFIAQVMDFTMANAPYPNLGLAFCGAISLQSYLCGRKVQTSTDLRPNIYLLSLASSGTGKDFPRKVNSRVLFEIGHIAALGDKFASGQGIQDALMRSPAMLFQNDEMDGVLRQINFDRENKHESIPNILLTLYTSANDVYPIRVKAGQKEASHVDQPHLTLFGTATPQYFYEALSHRMLTNGLFARMIIVDIGRRGRGQLPGSARNLPEEILQTARWWAEFSPGKPMAGNLYGIHPAPKIVPFTPEAKEALGRLQRMGEDEWDKAHAVGDEPGQTAWSRTCENATRLALIYACSENHEEPVIAPPAIEWATAFAMHQTRRQLHMATTYVAENPFHAECLKLLRRVADEPGRRMQRQHLLRVMRCKAADFDQIVATLIQQGDIVPVDIPTKTKTAQGYQLA